MLHEIRVETTGNGHYALAWPSAFTAAPVDVFTGLSPLHIDRSRPLVSGALGAARIDGLSPNRRHYFALRLADGSEHVVAERNLPIDGAVNFRDLGGYAAADGRVVQWGRLYRSGHLSTVSQSGMAYFESLNIDAVCDFRLSQERAREQRSLGRDVQLETLEIPPGVKDPQFLHRVFAQASGPEDVVTAVHEVVRSLVDESASRYRRLFEVLLANGERNILLNCSAGKERTGIGSALVLTALGVPRETIYYDFMLSRLYFPAEREIPRVLAKYEIGLVGDAARELVMPLLETRESYLRVAFDFIDARYGGGLEFLKDRFDLGTAELEQLRAYYTI